MNPNFTHFIESALAADAAKGLTRTLSPFSSRQGPVQVRGGRDLIMLSGNNYLGLAGDPEIERQAVEAVRAYGIGSGASRAISGTLELHVACEEAIRAFKGAEAALLFSCGYMANMGVLTAIADREDLILSDELNHASIIDGCRLSRAEVRVFRHKDIGDIREKLADRERFRQVFLVTDGVFSMDGDIAPLDQYVALARQFDFALVVDDAHGVGVLGPGGRGTPHHFGVEKDIDITIGTLGKAIGSYGAYVTCSAAVRQFLINRARSFIFTTALPPFVAGSVLAAFRHLRQHGGELVQELRDKTAYYRAGIERLGIFTFHSETNIVPLYTGTVERTMSISKALIDAGVFAYGIRPPTVPAGQGRIRTTIMRTHTYEHLDMALAAMEQAFGRNFPSR